MKKFDTPVLVEVTDLAEGVYASSGAIVVNPNPTTSPTPAPGQDLWELRWGHHNSGSHSTVRICTKGNSSVYFGKSGNLIRFTIQIPSAKISSIKEWGGDVGVTDLGDTLIVERRNWYNETEYINLYLGAFVFNCTETGSYYPSKPEYCDLVISDGSFRITNVEYL